MVLKALVVQTGKQRIGANKRSATLAVYHDGSEVVRFDADLDAPKIGDKWLLKLEKEEV